MSVIITYGAIVLGLLATGMAIVWVLQQPRSPQSALAWILFIVLVPYVGVPLFFVLGVRKRGTRYDEIAFAPAEATPPQHRLDDQLTRLGLPQAAPGHGIVFETEPQSARASLARLVAGARVSLDVVLYRLDPDAYGEEFVAALAQAVARGVRVRLILDQFGTWRRPRKALKALRAAGGELRLFSPVHSLAATGRLNLRNHRKMVIADGEAVWSGGRNVGRSYLGPQDHPGTWLDLSFVITGPVVQRYAEVFEADWAKDTGPLHQASTPAPATGGDAIAQLIPSGPDLPHDGLHDALVHAIHTARERIWIVTPYLLPTDHLLHALTTAARLGRDVRLIVPARSNQHLADFARGTYLRHLEEAGCRILRHTGAMLHAKAAIFDDAAIIGSANLDVRSMLLNFETALALYDARSVATLASWFATLEKSCKVGTKPANLPRRLAEATFRLGAPIL
jgi:cardiolipin synthase A/B